MPDPALTRVLRHVVPHEKGSKLPAQPPHIVAHISATRPREAPDSQRTSVPCYSVTIDEHVGANAAKRYTSMLEAHPDGTVTTDPALLEQLTTAIRDRARSRGSLVATERDVREAAALYGRDVGHVASPADAIPLHNKQLQHDLG